MCWRGTAFRQGLARFCQGWVLLGLGLARAESCSAGAPGRVGVEALLCGWLRGWGWVLGWVSAWVLVWILVWVLVFVFIFDFDRQMFLQEGFNGVVFLLGEEFGFPIFHAGDDEEGF